MPEWGEVFIRYSWDSESHSKSVLPLSNQLRSDGIDCVLDQYEVSPPEGWRRWMDRKIADSSLAIVACTEIYFKCVMGREVHDRGEPCSGTAILLINTFTPSHLARSIRSALLIRGPSHFLGRLDPPRFAPCGCDYLFSKQAAKSTSKEPTHSTDGEHRKERFHDYCAHVARSARER
jgi:TIR domain